MTAEDLLTRTFTEVTESTDYTPTPLATVVARATARRGAQRRRVAYAAAAAVVVVGGVAAGLTLKGGDDAPPAPAGPLGELSPGPAPRIGYIDGDTFVTTSGQRFTSPLLKKAEAAVAWRNGVLVVGSATSGRPYSEISFLSGGAPARLGCGTSGLVVPAGGGDPLYWLASDCQDLYQSGQFVQGSTSTDTTVGARFTPVGEVEGGIVTAASSTQLRLPSHGLVVPLGHQPSVPLPLLLPRAATARGDLVSGVALRGLGSAVVDATTGQVQWRRARWTIGKFSPSGQYVAGDQQIGRQTDPAIGDSVGIFDARTGRQVVSRELPGLVIDTLPVWEGDDAVLVVAEDRRGREAIVRVALDGTVTRATRVVPWLPRPDEGRPPTPWFRPAATP